MPTPSIESLGEAEPVKSPTPITLVIGYDAIMFALERGTTPPGSPEDIAKVQAVINLASRDDGK